MASLSLVLVNYNDSKWLINWVDSICTQWPDELIIVDDCSNDGSQELMNCISKKYPAIKIIYKHINEGPFPTFMAGVKASTCEYVSCWSVDDSPMPGYTSAMRQAIRDYPLVDIITCNAWIEREGRHYKRTTVPFDSYISPDLLFKSDLSALNVIGNVVRKKHLLQCWESGGKDLKTHFDGLFIFTAAFHTGMIVLGEYLVLYRANMKGFGSSRRLKDNLASVRKLRDIAPLFPDSYKYLSKMNMWEDRAVIISTLILQVFPHLPKFIRRMVYKKVYGATL